MNVRFVLGATLAMAIVTTAVMAQSDPIAARQALMKGNDEGARVAIGMMRGRIPFDRAKIDAAFGQWAETAAKLPALFPDNSKTGGDTHASPKIWQAKADFDAKAAAFGKAVADMRASGTASLEGLKAAIPVLGKACDNCHADYRTPMK